MESLSYKNNVTEQIQLNVLLIVRIHTLVILAHKSDKALYVILNVQILVSMDYRLMDTNALELLVVLPVVMERFLLKRSVIKDPFQPDVHLTVLKFLKDGTVRPV